MWGALVGKFAKREAPRAPLWSTPMWTPTSTLKNLAVNLMAASQWYQQAPVQLNPTAGPPDSQGENDLDGCRQQPVGQSAAPHGQDRRPGMVGRAFRVYKGPPSPCGGSGYSPPCAPPPPPRRLTGSGRPPSWERSRRAPTFQKALHRRGPSPGAANGSKPAVDCLLGYCTVPRDQDLEAGGLVAETRAQDVRPGQGEQSAQDGSSLS